MTDHTRPPHRDGVHNGAGPPRDGDAPDALDTLLRDWHEQNRVRAAASRDALLNRLSPEFTRRAAAHQTERARALVILSLIRRFAMNRYTHVAASLMVLVAIATLLFTPLGQTSVAAASDDVVLVPEGGQLNAFDEDGQLIGPCALKHTDVKVNVSGHFSRVNVTQRYHNPYDYKIEAVYTFPLSHTGAVDRMTMTVGDRVVQGEVEEREQARQIYEAARAQGYVASLLEQERPNIFTQSVANIEPGAEVIIEISYVEVLESRDGEYRFDFPMVVAPRYTPGTPTGVQIDALPEDVMRREGVVLLGPADFSCQRGDCGGLDANFVRRFFVPLDRNAQIINLEQRQREDPMVVFQSTYQDGSAEPGVIFADGVGHVGGRWFFCPPRVLPKPGEPFSPPTDQVPDADRVTPMPVKPDQRAGHDISVTLSIDTGGPGITSIASNSHEIVRDDVETARADGHPQRATVTLASGDNIPNRDFRLNWTLTSEKIEEAILTHTGNYGDFEGGFFTLILQPPDRVADEDARQRELIFVLDNSGSMRGFPIETAKKVISQAIDTMRPSDRFNIVSFNNTVDQLWPQSQPNTAESRARAQRYIEERTGGGGTEMRSAVLRALNADRNVGGGQPESQASKPLSPMDLANLPADGRPAVVLVPLADIEVRDGHRHVIRVSNDVALALTLNADLPMFLQPEGVELLMHGRWVTQAGQRVFIVDQAQAFDDQDAAEPMRIVLFVTDGLISNDDAVIQAVRDNAHETRMFTIGMGQAPNRNVLDEMARAGRGASDYALPHDDADGIVQRFAERIATPVLTDIELSFSHGLNVTDVLPTPEHMPDLFDVQPLVIHGRYTDAGRGSLTIRGWTGAGRYERTLDLELPELQPQHDTIATLWAREKVSELMREGQVEPVIALGKDFQIMTRYTSFVAVEKRRVTVGGEPVLVRVPIEFPKDMSWEGVFGGDAFAPRPELVEEVREQGIEATLQEVRRLQGEMDYDGALRRVNALLEVTPENEIALTLRDALQATRVAMMMRELGPTADADVFNYPSDWPEVSARRQRAETEQDARRRAQTASPPPARPDAAPAAPLVMPEPAAPGADSAGRVLYSRSMPARQSEPAATAPGAPAPSAGGAGGGGGFGGGGGAGSRGAQAGAEIFSFSADLPFLGDRVAHLGDIPILGTPFAGESLGASVYSLRHIDQEAVGDRLRLVIESAEQAEGVRMGLSPAHVVDLPDTDALHLLVLSPLRDTIAPFAEQLADESLDDEARAAVIDDLVAALQKRIPEVQRDLRLRRVLDDALYAMIAPSDEDNDDVRTPAADSSLIVTLLLTDTEPATLDAVSEIGFAVDEVVDGASFVVGRIDVGDLEALALHAATRRIEFVGLQDAPGR
jgi:hypothetical protein